MSASAVEAVKSDAGPRVSKEQVGLLARLVLAVLGTALSISAFALWLTPGASAEPELSLMKLGVSVFMLICGMSCLIAARPTVKERRERGL